jgi:hypothetical protein
MFSFPSMGSPLSHQTKKMACRLFNVFSRVERGDCSNTRTIWSKEQRIREVADPLPARLEAERTGQQLNFIAGVRGWGA